MKIRFGFNDSIKVTIPRKFTRVNNDAISDKEYIMCLYGCPHEKSKSLVNNFLMLRIYAARHVTGMDNNRFASGFNYDECYNRALGKETKTYVNVSYDWNHFSRRHEIENQARSAAYHSKRKSGIQIGVLDDSFIRL